jgi:hypothetical protein
LTIDLELIETLCFQHKFSEPAEKLILASPKTIVVNYEDSVSLNSTEVLSLVGVENRRYIKDVIGKTTDLDWKLSHISNIIEVKKTFNDACKRYGIDYSVE